MNSSRSKPYPNHNNRNRPRLMTTYVDSKKCAVINSLKRGVLASIDGRFAINNKGFYLFASNRLEFMPDLLVKYVELKGKCLSELEVRQEAQKNRIFSSWEKDKEIQLKLLRSNLTLQTLFKKPPTIWNHPAIMAEFGDAYLEGSGLEGIYIFLFF